MNHHDNDKTIFNATDIQQYLSGRMSSAEMHNLEKAALEDPFLADAIDGYQAEALNTSNDIKELHERLEKRISAPKRKATIISYSKYLKVAAVVLLLCGSAVSLYFLTNNLTNSKTTVATTTVTGNKKHIKDSFSAPVPIREQATVMSMPKKEKPASKLLQDKEIKPIKSAPKISSQDVLQNPSPAPASGYVLKKQDSLLAKDEQEVAAKKEIIMNRQTTTISNNRDMNALRKASPAIIISGTVVNQDNQPVPNASISVLSEPKQPYLATDSNGKFKFVTVDSVATVMVTRIGYETVRTKLEGKVAGAEIKLKPRDQSLNEVVVVGYGSKTKRSLDKSSLNEKMLVKPDSGFAAFNNYIGLNKKVDANTHGEVILSFMVSKNGKLSDFKVKKSASPLLDAEAIRLVKEGPGWKSSTNKKVRATVTINF